LVDGIDTTRTVMPSASSVFCAASASDTSEPVAISTASTLPAASDST
jgi:hypothetical protein